MKARVPRPWESLPKAQKDRIEEHAKDIAMEYVQKDLRLMLDLYIKMVCVTLHDAFGYGEKRLNMFLGNHKMLFREQIKKVHDNTQIAYLNKRMDEIFHKNGFPDELFAKMLGEVIIVEEE